MASAIRELFDIELSEIEDAVGSRSFARGRSYARAARVLNVAWDADAETLTGTVAGQGAVYDTAAFFVDGRSGVLSFEDGECTCPVGYNCKHVAALVIAAATARRRAGDRPSRRAPRRGAGTRRRRAGSSRCAR